MRFSLVALLACAACNGPKWTLVEADLDRVPLCVWPDGGRGLFVSGGPLGSAGQSLFRYYNGSSWREVEVGRSETLWWVHAFSPADAFTVGEGGVILRWNGSTLAAESSPTMRTLYGVWGASPDDLWAVGGMPDVDGVILHRDASGWSVVGGLPNTGAFFKVWGSAADDVFACGQGGTIVHFDGREWKAQPTGVQPFQPLFTVGGRGRDEVYAVGGQGGGIALRWDGSAWSRITDENVVDTLSLAGVAAAADGRVSMVGGNGAMLRGRPGAFSDDSGAVTHTDLHSTTFAAGAVWAVGGNWIPPAPTVRRGVIARYGE